MLNPLQSLKNAFLRAPNMSFGFSVGDIVAFSKLVVNVVASLNETGGEASPIIRSSYASLGPFRRLYAI